VNRKVALCLKVLLVPVLVSCFGSDTVASVTHEQVHVFGSHHPDHPLNESDDEKVSIVLEQHNFGVEYHINRPVSEANLVHGFELPIQDYHESRMDELGDIGQTVLECAAAISGVKSVYVETYSFTIIVGNAFDRDSFDAPMIECIKKGLGVSDVEVIDKYYKWGFPIPRITPPDPDLRPYINTSKNKTITAALRRCCLF